MHVSLLGRVHGDKREVSAGLGGRLEAQVTVCGEKRIRSIGDEDVPVILQTATPKQRERVEPHDY